MSLLISIFSKIFSIFSRFKKKKTNIEQLEGIEKEMKDLEKYKHTNDLNERKYIGALVIYSFIIYIILAIVYYIYLIPKNRFDRIKTLIPFVVMPLIIYMLRRLIKWVFIKRTTYYEKRLHQLKTKKNEILEEVKEKETYKIAREILERFSPGSEMTPPKSPKMETLNRINSSDPNMVLTRRNVPQQILNSSQMPSRIKPVQRNTANLNNTFSVSSDSPANTNEGKSSLANATLSSVQLTSTMREPQSPPQSVLNQSTLNRTNDLGQQIQQQPNRARPIPVPNRGVFDKLLDFVIGDGPNNRYALICKNCHFHNGMALKEEFEYIAFRCAYCLFYNESRKTKLTVPKITMNTVNSSLSGEASTKLSNGKLDNQSENDSTFTEPASPNGDVKSTESFIKAATKKSELIDRMSQSNNDLASSRTNMEDINHLVRSNLKEISKSQCSLADSKREKDNNRNGSISNNMNMMDISNTSETDLLNKTNSKSMEELQS